MPNPIPIVTTVPDVPDHDIASRVSRLEVHSAIVIARLDMSDELAKERHTQLKDTMSSTRNDVGAMRQMLADEAAAKAEHRQEKALAAQATAQAEAAASSDKWTTVRTIVTPTNLGILLLLVGALGLIAKGEMDKEAFSQLVQSAPVSAAPADATVPVEPAP